MIIVAGHGLVDTTQLAHLSGTLHCLVATSRSITVGYEPPGQVRRPEACRAFTPRPAADDGLAE